MSTAKSFGQAVAPPGCLSADRASQNWLADDRLEQKLLDSGNLDVSSKSRSRRSLESLRRKRLRRNKKKSEELRLISREGKVTNHQRKLNELKGRMSELQGAYNKEKKLSAFMWSKWQEVEKKHKLQFIR